MNAYEELHNLARQTRDKAISKARVEYRESVRQIDKLAIRLNGEVPRSRPAKEYGSIIEMVCELIPKDKPFTFADVHKALCDAEPGRAFNESSIRTILPKLELRGVIRRVSKNQSGRVLWAAVDADVPKSPYGAMALTDIAKKILRESGPKTPTELVVAIQEHGYRDDSDPRRMIASLKNAARRYPERFKTDDKGRWAVN